MPYTLQGARNNQDEAKRKADKTTNTTIHQNHMNDVMFWTGYIAAMIDWDYPPSIIMGTDISNASPSLGVVPKKDNMSWSKNI